MRHLEYIITNSYKEKYFNNFNCKKNMYIFYLLALVENGKL